MQEDFKVDIFGFGKKLEMYHPNVWKSIKEDWKELFSGIQVSVNVELEIRGSATTRKPIMTGE